MLSMNADATPDTQSNSSTATINLFSGEAREIVLEMPSAMESNIPYLLRPPFMMYRTDKEIIVVHTTASDSSSRRSGDITRSFGAGPSGAVVVASSNGWWMTELAN